MIWQRVEDYGWDAEDRAYIYLADKRLYRRTDPPPPPEPKAKPKKNSKKARASLRASKRRKLSEPAESEHDATPEVEESITIIEKEDDGFGGMVWECVAITLEEFTALASSMEKTRDPNEKALRKRIIEEILPDLEKVEEKRKQKAALAEKELLVLEKLATAKRSSRIRGKVEQQKHDEEQREAERKKAADLVMAKKEQAKWMKLEKERESRMITREQRLKEREVRRILHEEELANLSEDGKKLETGESRLSERHLKAEIERKKQELEDLAEEEDWIFDCICGAYGQIDDGTHSIACEKCNIWQHSKCVGVSEEEAERTEFEFICTTCVRRAKDAERAKTQPPIKIKLNRPGSSSSSGLPKENGGSPTGLLPSTSNGTSDIQASPTKPRQQLPLPFDSPPKKKLPQMASWQTSSIPSMKDVQAQQAPSEPSMGPSLRETVEPPTSAPQAPLGRTDPYSSYSTNGSNSTPQQSFSHPSGSHAFSSPHPQSPINLPPPSQNKVYQFVNGNNQYNHNGSGESSQVQGTPLHSASQGYSGARPGSSDGGYRRNSVTMPSPLASAPILAPGIQTPAPAFHPSGSPAGSVHLPPNSSPPTSQDVPTDSTLPPSSTGISPTKHSPPRITSNGHLGSATPSMLPPVASLSPTSHFQDLTPPVKTSSDGSWNRPTGQGIAGQGSSF